MKELISKAKDLGQTASEIEAAIRQLPPKLGELRETAAAAKQQLFQLKSDIQQSAAITHDGEVKHARTKEALQKAGL